MGVLQFDKEDSKVLIQLLEYQVLTVSINQHYVCYIDFILLVYEATSLLPAVNFRVMEGVMRQSAKQFENQIAVPCVKGL